MHFASFKWTPLVDVCAIKAKDAHVGNVKELNLPKAPEPPKTPSDLASELSAYEATRPHLAEAAPATAAGSADAASSADGFLAFLEQVGSNCELPYSEVPYS